MSMLYDIKQTFRKAHGVFGLEQEKCAELFLNVLSALEWDMDDYYTIDYDDEEWEAKELKEAIKLLFPDS